MKQNKIDRRNFLQLAMTGAAGTAIPAGAAAGDTSGNQLKSSTRPGNIFAYGYQEGAYKLEPGPHLFIDWRYVQPGRVRWERPNQKETPLWAYEKIEGVIGVPSRIPYGLKLVPQVAEKTGPVIPNDREWEFMIFGYCSLHDLGAKFGLWYEVVPPKEDGKTNLLCYAESTDGVNWQKPSLGLVEFRGSKANNIVIDGASCPYGQFHGNSVFIDPNAPADERFKVIYWTKNIPKSVMEQLQREDPESISPYGAKMQCGTLLGTSPDGMRWKFSDKVLFMHVCDTQTTVSYDPFLKRYVCFTRTFLMGRRAIARTETADITRWPAPELVLWTPPDADPSDDLYCNAKTIYPGSRTMHLMFPTVYRRRADTCVIRMASSLESQVWEWMPGEILRCGDDGTWDGGCLFAGSGLRETPGDKVVVPYCGYEYPHKYPRFGRFGQLGMAVWPKERLVALEAHEDAEFWTPEFILPGQTLHLNFDVKRAGYIQVEIEGVKGRKLADCDPLFGNSLKKQVAWKGNASLGVENDKPVPLRFRMRSAKLFSFEVK
jgi:hypothetical protein